MNAAAMCDDLTPLFLLIFMVPAFICGVIRLVLIMFDWTKSRGLQSIKALGLVVVVLCGLAGLAYGICLNLNIETQEEASRYIVGFLCGVPFLDLARRTWKNSRDYALVIWLPISLIAMYFGWAAAHFGIPLASSIFSSLKALISWYSLPPP